VESTITRWWACEFFLTILLAFTTEGNSEHGMWYLVRPYVVNTSSLITRNTACKLITNMAIVRNIMSDKFNRCKTVLNGQKI